MVRGHQQDYLVGDTRTHGLLYHRDAGSDLLEAAKGARRLREMVQAIPGMDSEAFIDALYGSDLGMQLLFE
jgi:hypothetical protein